MCEEHRDIAEVYLKRQDLSTKHRLLLRYWYNDQSTRLFIYQLVEGNFKEVMTIAKDGFRKYHIIWPLAFLCTTGVIITKKSLQLVTQVFE